MVHEVGWNKDIIVNFIKYGNLSDDDRELLKLRTSNHTDVEIADELCISVATYYRRVEKLKKLYDKVRIEYPQANLPQRKQLSSKLFDLYDKKNALEFVNNLDFEHEYLEVKIIRRKK